MTITVTSTTLTPTLDDAKVEQFTHSIIGDLGAAISAVMIRIGDRLGLYRALGESLPVTSLDLATRGCSSSRARVSGKDPLTRFALLLVGGDGAWKALAKEPMLRSRIYRRVVFRALTGDQCAS